MLALPTKTRLHNAVIVGAALAGLHTTAASAATPVTVVLGYIPDVESFGAYYAKAKGYFTDEGLDVTLIPAGTGIDQVQMVDSGQATIGIGGPEQVLAAVDKGVKLKVFASEFQTSPVSHDLPPGRGRHQARRAQGQAARRQAECRALRQAVPVEERPLHG